MTYQEARATYEKLFSKFPSVGNVWEDNEEERPIICTTERFEKRGSRWIITESKIENVNFIYYYNTVDPRASAFFRNLGGYEKTVCTYTKRGFIPTECVSISPDRTAKTVRTFEF